MFWTNFISYIIHIKVDDDSDDIMATPIFDWE